MTIATAIADKLEELAHEHRRQWRQWAHDIAAGKPAPNPAAVLDVSSALGIDDPGQELEADADAVRELHAAEGAIETCQARCRELLTPWKGDAGKVRAALAAAELEVDRLRKIVDEIDDECSAGYWRGVIGQLMRRHPRVFQEDNR